MWHKEFLCNFLQAAVSQRLFRFKRDSNKCSLWNDVFLHTFFFENAETVLFSLVRTYRPYPAFLWETKRFFLHQIGTPFPPSLARHTDRRATELSNVCGKEERKRGENGRRRRRPDVTYPKRCTFGRRRRHGYGWVTGWLFGKRREGRRGGGKGG